VEASEDSICGGEAMTMDQQQQHPEQNDGTSPSISPSSLIGIIPSTNNSSSSPPKVEVTYRLSQQYGSFFSVHSLLVVTVQVRRGSCSEKVVRKITQPKVATVPLATSTPTAVTSTVAAATIHAAGVLAKAASKIVVAATTTATTRGQHSDNGAGYRPQGATAPLVAEVVRIEERWNGVQLLHFAPFHWSRRLNGLCLGSVAFLLFH